jgi:hypothetical protein
LCSRHRTLSQGPCPQCVSDRYERRRLHVSAEGKKFRAAILERDGFVCHWCGGEAGSVDYLRALVDGGSLSTSQTQWLLVFGATFDAARE